MLTVRPLQLLGGIDQRLALLLVFQRPTNVVTNAANRCMVIQVKHLATFHQPPQCSAAGRESAVTHQHAAIAARGVPQQPEDIEQGPLPKIGKKCLRCW